MADLGEAKAFYGEAGGYFGEAAQAFMAAEQAAGAAASSQDGVTEAAERLATTAHEVSDHAPAIGATSLKSLRFLIAENADWHLHVATDIDPRGRNPVAERIEQLMERQLALVDVLGEAVNLAEELQSICAEAKEASDKRSVAIRQAQSGLYGAAQQAALLSEEANRESQSL